MLAPRAIEAGEQQSCGREQREPQVSMGQDHRDREHRGEGEDRDDDRTSRSVLPTPIGQHSEQLLVV
jgi:hypothetical protein